MKALPVHNEDVFLSFKELFTRSTVYVPSDPLAVATCTTEGKEDPSGLSAFRTQKKSAGGEVQWTRLLSVPELGSRCRIPSAWGGCRLSTFLLRWKMMRSVTLNGSTMDLLEPKPIKVT